MPAAIIRDDIFRMKTKITTSQLFTSFAIFFTKLRSKKRFTTKNFIDEGYEKEKSVIITSVEQELLKRADFFDIREKTLCFFPFSHNFTKKP